jgi:hypothetical protein
MGDKLFNCLEGRQRFAVSSLYYNAIFSRDDFGLAILGQAGRHEANVIIEEHGPLSMLDDPYKHFGQAITNEAKPFGCA